MPSAVEPASSSSSTPATYSAMLKSEGGGSNLCIPMHRVRLPSLMVVGTRAPLLLLRLNLVNTRNNSNSVRVVGAVAVAVAVAVVAGI
ncbi:hypothetical protein PG988_006308 [Apiospora saccharicola]